ncbi:MAG: 5-formyltetrahydrofolate cyclo-ligase [Oscillospiraceae bacterium]|nr:5-formyltetrahydrofolate cyclo-ligase [Oscillospiraceae bacterium]
MREKVELRKSLLQKRRGIQNKPQKDMAIFKNLTKLPEFEKARLVVTYVSTELEADTHRLLRHCLEKSIAVAIPAIINEEMKFFRLIKMWEIGEEIDFYAPDLGTQLAVVPGLAYNKAHYRLGYGGGYYDRFLCGFNGKKIGLCYEEFILDIPVEQHDRKVDMVITEGTR